ncbi:MAG: ABC transporter permease [Elusimicrobia bacterium]|nr:ABC transporter permease [Elusimicrobiota bacterium]
MEKIGAFSCFGGKILGWAEVCGGIAILMRRTVYWFFKAPLNRKNTFQQMVEMGARTLPVTSLTLLFTGMVLALQTGYSFIKVFNDPLYVGRLVGFTIVKELGPVLTAIVFSGRVGAAVAAELGTMKVTEQIDALYTLGTNPVRYLVVPRILAALLMLPVLTVYSDFLGIMGGYAVAHFRFGISSVVYFDEIYVLRFVEVLHGMIKSAVFALIVITISCYHGLETHGGAEGVGRATTSAVVASMVLILVGDYFLTAILVAFGIG